MEEFSIKGIGDFVKISFAEVYDFPNKTSYQGGYDIEAVLGIKSGSFQVNAKLYTSTGEIYEFYKQLKLRNEQLNGIVKFETYEVDFNLTLEYDLQGHLKVEGSYAEDYKFRNELKFGFETDQSYISSTLAELKVIVDKYGDWNGVKNKASN